MTHHPKPLHLLLAAVGGLLLTGCLNLKPVQSTTRHFVLSSIPAAPAASALAGGPHLAVGVGQVKLPGYLFRTSMAVRKSPTEVSYLENAAWAERLDTGCQRVLAANLAALLPTDNIHLSAWRPQEVACEVQVVLDQFDVGTDGGAVLVARWRVLSPGGVITLKAGDSHLSKQGSAPASSPQAAAATLSDLLADLSRELASAIKANVPSPR